MVRNVKLRKKNKRQKQKQKNKKKHGKQIPKSPPQLIVNEHKIFTLTLYSGAARTGTKGGGCSFQIGAFHEDQPRAKGVLEPPKCPLPLDTHLLYIHLTYGLLHRTLSTCH